MLKKNGSRNIDVIGGADGPTSVYLIKQTKKKSFRRYVRNLIYKYKGKRAEKAIVPGTHTLTELIDYATDIYAAVELDKSHRRYTMRRDSMKESLVVRFRPDLLGEWKDIPFVETENQEEMKYWSQRWEKRSEYIASIPDEALSMDFHIHEIEILNGRVELDIDYTWNEFQISYSGKKKRAIKIAKKIALDLAMYYGVTADDIKNRTERYKSLLACLSH